MVFFNRFFEPDVDVERMTFVESSPYSEPTELLSLIHIFPIPDWKRSYFSVPASAQVLTPLMVIRVEMCIRDRTNFFQ